jgi:hypothetical protein
LKPLAWDIKKFSVSVVVKNKASSMEGGTQAFTPELNELSLIGMDLPLWVVISIWLDRS